MEQQGESQPGEDAQTTDEVDTLKDYSVIAYSKEALLDLFVDRPGASAEFVGSKLHSIYFPNYFDYLKAKTIVVEEDYVDRDYLEDYVGYYARCFNPPSQRCTRLHFFQSSFSETEFESFLTGKTDRNSFLKSKLNSKVYLGFIVLKPLSQTFIGRTCLRTYPTKGTGRHFPSLREYEVNLFGATLNVLTLAFQEQDAEVARCATAALWSTFQGTAKKFGHSVPTPIEITKHAVAIHSYQSRTLPAKDGLTPEQMGDAIRKMNLEPYFAAVPERTHLQAEAYAYLRAGIPALLVVSLVDTRDKLNVRRPRGVWYGRHAIVLTGYHMSQQPPMPIGDTSVYLRATRIDKFYGHDDQVGPFSKLTLSKSGETFEWDDEFGDAKKTFFLESSWWGESEEIGSVYIVPETIIVPLYPKMRITFREALEGMKEFDAALMSLAALGYVQLEGAFEWDLFLTTGSDFKSELLTSQSISEVYAGDLLTMSMPRFLWRAVAYQNGSPALELLFDATAILQGNFFFRGVEYHPGMLRVLRNPTAIDFAPDDITRAIFTWFRDH